MKGLYFFSHIFRLKDQVAMNLQFGLMTAQRNEPITRLMKRMFDSMDLKIIRILQKDARLPFSEIAKMLGESASTVQMRYNKMKKAGIIMGTTLILDRKKFGVRNLVSIGVKTSEPYLEEVIEYMNNTLGTESKIMTWPTFGRFNISALVMSKNLLEPYKIKQAIKMHPYVKDVSLSISIAWLTTNDEALGLEKEFRGNSFG